MLIEHVTTFGACAELEMIRESLAMGIITVGAAGRRIAIHGTGNNLMNAGDIVTIDGATVINHWLWAGAKMQLIKKCRDDYDLWEMVSLSDGNLYYFYECQLAIPKAS